MDRINAMNTTSFDLTAVYDNLSRAEEAAAAMYAKIDHIDHDTFDTRYNEVNLSPCRSAMVGLHSVNSANLCVLHLTT